MSRPVPSAHALRVLRAHLSSESYTCTACLRVSSSPASRLHKSGRRQTTRARSTLTAHKFRPEATGPATQRVNTGWRAEQQRRITYVAPVTSVNAARNVPEQNRELHNALGALESVAAEYVNLSLLALALRGLEARDPITRIAVQSSASREDARRLVRLLLADPTAPEEEWESLLARDDADERALLIRYAEITDMDSSNPLVRVLSVPAKALERHRLELLLVHREEHGSRAGRALQIEEDSLVQTIETPISTTGRHSQVAYPVHKVLLHGKGVSGLLNTQFDEHGTEDWRNAPRYAVIDLAQKDPPQAPADYSLSLVSVGQAEHALIEARKVSSKDPNSPRDWQSNGSSISKVSQYLYFGILPSTTLKPLHRIYISNLLDAAFARLAQEQTALEMMQPSRHELEALSKPLLEATTLWSEAAHTELRNELANAFAGRSWRRLAWWKLPLRVDDVGMIGADILSRFYLADAEKGSIWLGGRLEQAGLSNNTEIARDVARQEALEREYRDFTGIKKYEEAVKVGENEGAGETPATTTPVDSAAAASRDVPATYFRASAPWPQQIALSRSKLLVRALPALQARAQSLLLQAMSGTSLGVAVGGLAYSMVSSTGLYEAGAVAALAAAVNVARLQRLWDRTKDDFERDVADEGVRVLERVERECRELVERGLPDGSGGGEGASEGGKGGVRLEGQEQRDAARAAIEEAREVLDRVQ